MSWRSYTYVALNGGAAAAFLTLVGAISKVNSHPDFMAVGGAIAFWLVGLLAATFATNWAYYAQRDFTKAYRIRRQGEELRRITELKTNPRIEPSHLGIRDPAEKLTQDANTAREEARDWSDGVPILRIGSMLFFAAGVGFALWAVQSSFIPIVVLGD